jgi:hypothetical protein
VDVGVIAVNPTAGLRIGEVVPEISGGGGSGGADAVRLADFRGKYLLLQVWTAGRVDSVNNLANLAATYDRFGDDERFAIVSVFVDDGTAPPVLRARPEWRQGRVELARMPREYLECPSLLFMIGPDGKLLAKNFDAVQAFGLIDNLLAGREGR